MHKYNRAVGDLILNHRGNVGGIAVLPVKGVYRPYDKRQTCVVSYGRVIGAVRGTKQLGLDSADVEYGVACGVYLICNTAARKGSKIGMIPGVICHLTSELHLTADTVGICFCKITELKEGCGRIILFKTIENTVGRLGSGAVVIGNGNHRLVGVYISAYRLDRNIIVACKSLYRSLGKYAVHRLGINGYNRYRLVSVVKATSRDISLTLGYCRHLTGCIYLCNIGV